jgi:NADH:ubiquinone oxidoreductase subunit F (NADH-binding)
VTAAPITESMPAVIGDPPAAHLADHLARFGPRPHRGRDLVDEVSRAGLLGRGGAGFPTARKLEAVQRNARHRGAFVVANGTEGEPLSEKDKTLLVHAPHLVLDGMVAAAEAVGAREAACCFERCSSPVTHALHRALEERRRSGGESIALRLEATPSRYVAGEESALVHWLNGGEAKPVFSSTRPFQRGVARMATLVDNVETLAHIALIARYGAATWRAHSEYLVTIKGAVTRPGVYSVARGASLRSVLRNAGASHARGVLVGGYFGTWLTPQQAAMAVLDPDELRAFGASIGCGAIAVVGGDVCPLVELGRVARWFAGQSAGQCGPCAFGLPALADGLEFIGRGADRDGRAEADVRRWLAMVEGRGACKMPDGAVRFIRSGLAVFGDHLVEHRTQGACTAVHAPPLLPVGTAAVEWR